MAKGKGKMPRIDLGGSEVAFKLLVSPHCAGKIIGRGGSEIAALRRQLGVGCHIHGPENCFPSTDLQVVVLFGACASIDYSFHGMVRKIAESEQEFTQPGQPFVILVVMTTNAVSAVIGTRGATIASLRQSTGCQISADKDSFQGEQLVRVTGPADRLPGALAALASFAFQSGDSLQFASQEYSPGAAMPALATPTLAPKGASKHKHGGSVHAGGMLGPRHGSAPALPEWRPSGVGGPRVQKRPLAELTDGQDGESGEVEVPEDKKSRPGRAAEIPEEVELPSETDPQVLEHQSAIAFTIPKDAIGRVLGKGGSSSAAIRRETGATLKIEPNEVEGVVTLSGTVEAVHRAHCLVIGRVLAEL